MVTDVIIVARFSILHLSVTVRLKEMIEQNFKCFRYSMKIDLSTNGDI